MEEKRGEGGGEEGKIRVLYPTPYSFLSERTWERAGKIKDKKEEEKKGGGGGGRSPTHQSFPLSLSPRMEGGRIKTGEGKKPQRRGEGRERREREGGKRPYRFSSTLLPFSSPRREIREKEDLKKGQRGKEGEEKKEGKKGQTTPLLP